MATKKTTIEYLLDQLSGLRGVRARAIFGEYALYLDDKVVALICDDELFVKITAEGKALLGDDYQEGFPYPGAKPAMQISGELLEDSKWLMKLISTTEKFLPQPKLKKKKSKK